MTSEYNVDDNRFLKVHESFLSRDRISKAVINTNEQERQAYLSRKNAIISKERKIQLLEDRVSHLEAEIENLKKLIKQ